MNNYLIVLNLFFADNSYTALDVFLKTSSRWARISKNVWMISTYRSAAEVRNGIKERVQSLDNILVIRANEKNWASYNLPKEIVDWLKAS